MLDDQTPTPGPDPVAEELDDEDFEEGIEEPDLEDEDEDWADYDMSRRRICLDHTGGRFPGF